MCDERERTGNLEREVLVHQGRTGRVPVQVQEGEVRNRIDRHLGVHIRGDREERVRCPACESFEGQGDLGGEGEDRQGRRGDAGAPSQGRPDPEVARPSQRHTRPAPAGQAPRVPRAPDHLREEQDTRGPSSQGDTKARGPEEAVHAQERRMDALARIADDRFQPELPGGHTGADKGGGVVPPGRVQRQAGCEADCDRAGHRVLRRPADPCGDRRRPPLPRPGEAVRVRGAGAEGAPVGFDHLPREYHEVWVAAPEVDTHGGGSCARQPLPGVAAVQVPPQGGKKEGLAEGHHRNCEEAASRHILDADKQRGVSQSWIEPRQKGCVAERVIRIEAGPDKGTEHQSAGEPRIEACPPICPPRIH